VHDDRAPLRQVPAPTPAHHAKSPAKDIAMPALSVIDLAMFLLETDERPFNVGPLAVLSPPKGLRGNFADKLVARMLRRPLGTPFNLRLHTPTLGVPTLEVDAGADAARHVHRMTLDAPGSMAQLGAAVCRIHEVRLDRSRLLWDLYVIDGLEDGKVALYGKVHHGIIDGRTFVEVVSNWFAVSPQDKTVRAMWEGVDRRPRASLARASLTTRVGGALRSMAGTAGSVLGLYRMLARQALATVGLGGDLTLPMIGVPKAFHGHAAADRSFAYCTLPIAEVKAVAKAHAATVNDVLLEVLDASMARLLLERGELPREPLIADMPLALQGASGGNQIAVLQFPLGAPGLAPLARLAAIRKQSGRVKAVLQRESADTVMLYTTVVHGIPALLERLGAKKHGLRVSNVLVSNPFGLPHECYLMGARVELALPMSVVAAGQMLNVTAVTLAGKLQIGFLAMPQVVPHVDRLAAYTVEAFAELQQASVPVAAHAPNPRTSRRGAAAAPVPSAAPKPRRARPTAKRTAAAGA
jgi:diacylglycerol O-acyltransferase / wax synthase